MSEKIIRDPVHDVIAFGLQRHVDALLFTLVNAREFQRLRRIRQLGLATLAYPGADHSRYSHSLGTMETARKMIQRLRLVTAIDEENETVCLAAALLHDLGHGPLSHVFERVTTVHHEELTRRIILDDQTDVHRVLAAHDRQLPAKVAAFLKGEPRREFLHDVVSSELDADRFDYLLRDNLMTGSRYGDYDLTWLLHSLVVGQAEGADGERLAVTRKGVSAVEAYLQCRGHMYANVYFHKVVRAAEGMVRLALRRATVLAQQGRLPRVADDDAVTRGLLGKELSTPELVDLDDVSILWCFKAWAGSSDLVLAELCNGLLFRRLYKTVDLGALAGTSRLQECVVAAQRAVADEEYELFYDHAVDASAAGAIAVVDDTGRALAKPDWPRHRVEFHRLHVAPERADAVRDVVARYL